MHVRLEPSASGSAASAEQQLRDARLGDLAPADRPYVFMNFVESADGRASRGGNTRGLGSDADLQMLLGLRTVADAVLVGPGTIRVEGYGRLVGDAGRRARRVEAGQVADPPCVVCSRGFDVPWEAGLFQAPEQPVIIYTAAANAVAPDCTAPVEVVRLDDYSSGAALHDLRARGVRALLSEGGPTLFRGLLDAGVVDELFLTLAPQLVAGTEQQILPGPPLDPAIELSLQWVLQAEQELFLRYRLASRT